MAATAKPAHFKVDPKLAALLGEAYRSSEEALRELVDNAWDADAGTVRITLPAEMTSDPLIVEDDGTGMTENDVRNEYLHIANDRRSRKGQHTTGKKRLVKGRKGIGKFAGLMAADTMVVETSARGQRSRLVIKKSNLLASVGHRDLERIDLPIETEPCDLDAHGTRITLAGLSQTLAFPSPEKLKQLLVQEYDRQEKFHVVVNEEPLTVEDIPGETVETSAILPGVGPVKLKFTISESRPLKHSGIAVRIGGKIVGRPSMLGLDQDETIPAKLFKRVYGEIEADGLADDVTADWGAIIENSLGLGAVREWANEALGEGVKRTFKNEVSLQKARLAKDVKQRLDRLPENRRKSAEQAVNRALERFYGESDERIKVVVGLMLEAFESDDYWLVLKSIDDATRADVTKLAEILDEFGIVDIAVVAQQAKRRLAFLDEFDQLVSMPATLEKEVHKAIENNLWILGTGYRLIASNKTLGKLLAEWMEKKFKGKRADKRPDLFLAALAPREHLLIEFKRPSHPIVRDDENQAIKYRDDLQPFVPGSTIRVLVIGGARDAKVATIYKTDELRVASYVELAAAARSDLSWIIGQVST